jgi:hypothetical protein
MRRDCKSSGQLLYTYEDKLGKVKQEDKISDRLVAEYLDLNFLGLRFEREIREHYDIETNRYKGRIDIKVMSKDWLKNRDAYYIIECKRLDGKSGLNREYVSEGISRFLFPIHNPQYPSYYSRNIMLGYVVNAINIAENILKIDCIQRKILVGITIGKMDFVYDDGEGFSHHKCTYQDFGTPAIELAHLFYDFSDVISENK